MDGWGSRTARVAQVLLSALLGLVIVFGAVWLIAAVRWQRSRSRCGACRDL